MVHFTLEPPRIDEFILILVNQTHRRLEIGLKLVAVLPQIMKQTYQLALRFEAYLRGKRLGYLSNSQQMIFKALWITSCFSDMGNVVW